MFFIATSNSGKLRELAALCGEFFPDLGPSQGRAPQNAEENGKTFLENALIKAKALSEELKKESQKNFWVLADDSGLCVEALDNRPGLLSARYAGDHVDPKRHVEKLLKELGPETKRLAKYCCGLALVGFQNGEEKIFSGYGECLGKIGWEAKGSSGFGYDPIFYIEGFSQSLGELDYSIKDKFSHRRRAFEELKKNFHFEK